MENASKPAGMSQYEFIYGRPNPLKGNPYEINKVEAQTELDWYAARKGMSILRLTVTDDTLQYDVVFPAYCCPSIMPLVNGSTALRILTDTWRNMRLNKETITLDTLLENSKKRLSAVDAEVADGIIDYIKSQPLEEYNELINRDEAKMIMMKARIQELMTYVPYCFLHEGIDIRNNIELDKFLEDFDRMYKFIINLDFIKDNVKRITGTLESVTNPYDYEL